MNVIISNKHKEMLDELNIDVIKNLNGEFNVDEIVNQFQNFFFQRMVLDITALKDYKDVKTLQKLSISLDTDKIILLLDDSIDDMNNDFLSKLISMGIYNFTKNIEGIMYLYNNPNSYRDVAHIQQLDGQMMDNAGNAGGYQENIIQGTRIIGIKNVTKQTGATTLAYMMKNQLAKHYQTVAIEVDKNDFSYFKDKSLITTTSEQVGNIVARNSDKDAIIIDINNSVQAEMICHDIIYLVEPSIIKLNKLMSSNSDAFKKLKNKKIILNQSLLSTKDVLEFEYESNSKIFFNMPPLDEREKSIHILNVFLCKLGFSRQQNNENEKKFSILGLFGK